MRNAIPKAIAYARDVQAIENHSFQAWLRQQIEREDLIWWARQEDNRTLLADDIWYHKAPWWRQLSGLIP